MKHTHSRWQQRFNNFIRAFDTLTDAVNLMEERELTQLEEQGLIQAFEYTHELAWKVMKDYLTEQGVQRITGSKDSTREAFKADLLADGDVWKRMIEARNETVHAYDAEMAQQIVHDIIEYFYLAISVFLATFNRLYAADDDSV